MMIDSLKFLEWWFSEVLKLEYHQNQEKSQHNTSFSAQKYKLLGTDMVFNTYLLIIVDSFILLQHVT